MWDGDREFRFLALAAPNLHHHEGQLHPDGRNRWPDAFETRDLLETLAQMGGTATRSFGLSVHIDGEPDGHLHGPGQYSEDGFRAYDRVIATAEALSIRLIFPFIDSHSFPNVRGIDEFAAWRDRPGVAFWTDAQLREDFRQLMHEVLNRRNTVTGRLYRDEPAILAWQLGNELDSYFPDRGMDYDEGLEVLTTWSLEMAAFLREAAPNHLVMEAGGRREAFLDDPNIDLLSDHYYEYWNRLFGKPYDLSRIHRESMAQIGGRKPLLVDEFGLAELDNLGSLIDAMIESGCSGGLLWSMREHHRDGGFYEHNEGGTNVNSYHWPGFAVADVYHERPILDLLRRKAYEIRGLECPPLPPPSGVPVLLSAEGGRLTWRGVTGASGYTIERREPGGLWTGVAEGVPDAQVTDVVAFEESRAVVRPPFWVDSQPVEGAEYRVIGTNSAGSTAPSGPAPTRA